MKGIKKILFLCILSLATLACVSCFHKPGDGTKRAIPSGSTLDSTYDLISLSDLTFNGKANQEVIRENKNTELTFDRQDPEGSLVFRFKYDVIDNNSSDSNAFRIHFDVADDMWNSDASVWFRGDGIYLAYYNGEKFTWNKTSALKLGMHEIEMGMIALFNNSNEPTGNYYLYYKLDGVEKDSYVNPYDLSKMNGDMFINFSEGNTQNKLYDISHIDGPYEIPDRISVKDLLYDSLTVGESIVLNEHHKYSYNASAEHNSVVFTFLYDAKTPSTIDCQFHFENGWIVSSHGGIFWLRDDKNRISKEGEGYYETEPFTKTGIYEVTLTKLYIISGDNQGKYYLSLTIDGVKKLEYIQSDMPLSNYIFTTGDNHDSIYDISYMPVSLDTDLYLYKYDPSMSGIEFSANLRKDISLYHELSEVGFMIYPQDDPSDATKVQGKIKESGNNYIIKAALVALDNENITRKYSCKLYYTMKNFKGVAKTYYTKAITSSFYDEMEDLSGLIEKYRNALNEIKSKVLNVTLNPHTCSATNALVSGSFSSNSITLTGSNSLYASFVLNGEALSENKRIMVGYRYYNVSLSSNKITLTKQTKKMIYGGSEHFVELNSGHDEKMTAANLSPMALDLGLKTIRIDVNFGRLFNLAQDNTLTVNYGYLSTVESVMEELKTNGGITDFLVVVQTILPYGFKNWQNKPWTDKTAPNPDTNPDEYLKWLNLNYEAMRLTAELLPEIHYFEAWNEPEIMSEENGPLARPDGSNYTVTEKAKILTDLMYYFNKAIKEVNPKNMLTSPSLCCAQKTDGDFDTSSPAFLRALYQQIADSTPVTGYILVDTNPDNYFQIINTHPYLERGTTQSNWSSFMNEFHQASVDFAHCGVEIWITEFGFPKDTFTNRYYFTYVLGQADNLEFLTRIYFYKIHDYTDKIDSHRWGLYDYDGNIKQIGTTVKNYIKSHS